MYRLSACAVAAALYIAAAAPIGSRSWAGAAFAVGLLFCLLVPVVGEMTGGPE